MGTFLITVGIIMTVIITVVGISIVAGMYSKLSEKQEQLEASIRNTQIEIKALLNGTQGIGDRINSIEQRFGRINERQSQVEIVSPSKVSYANASKLISLGATIDEVVKTCGLTRAEAELVAIMQGKAAI